MKFFIYLLPLFAGAIEPVLIKSEGYQFDPFVIYSPNHKYYALVTYGTGNSEFVPFDQFILKDNSNRIIYTKANFNHTVVDISDNGWVMGADFDGPISGKAILHFYDSKGVKHNTAEIGFFNQRAYSTDGSVYCVLDGLNGLRVFKADGTPLYNLGKGNTFAVSDDGSYIALALDEEIVLFFRGSQWGRIPVISPFIRKIKFSPDNSILCFIDRKNLYVYGVSDRQLIIRYEEKKSERNFISLDIARDNKTIIAGLDEDFGRNSGARHKKGYVYLFNINDGLIWHTGLNYDNWDITIPEVKFIDHSTFIVRTNSEVLRYSYTH
ncbi:MAG: hypothetical protein ABIL46_03070 [candidate division WOR-3 bacterium]